MYTILSGRKSKKKGYKLMTSEIKEPNVTKPTKESPCGYTIDSETGSMLLIDILYDQGKINKVTYDNIQKKYGNKKNKESEVSKHEK